MLDYWYFQLKSIMSEIYLTYDEHRRGGDIRTGQESYAWPSYEDSYIEFIPKGLFAKKGDWQETVEVTFDPKDFIDQDIYIVVVRYETGSTFGRIYGAWSTPGAFVSLEEAHTMKDIIENGDYITGYEKYRTRWPNAHRHPCWAGYFERLSSVEIFCTKLRDSEAKGVSYF